MKIVLLTLALTISTLFILSCKKDSSKTVEVVKPIKSTKPLVCNSKTELLVENKCVAIEKIEECGPAGHSHGAGNCHCYSGRMPREINGKKYCL